MAKTGSAEQWTRFLAEHRRALFVYAASLTRSSDAAADLIQDVLVRLLRADRDPSIGLAYVLRCLRNQALDARRRDRTNSNAALDELPSTVFLAQSNDAEACRLAREALRGLASDAREIVVLRIYGELSFREIAELFEAPLGTVTSAYRRALEALRETLGSEVGHV